MGRESWGTPPFRGREWEADTDGGGKMMEAADKKEKSMISYAGSRQRQGRGCPVLGTVIKEVPANSITTWEPAEMPVLGPRGGEEREGGGSASASPPGCA